jgi:bifunctional UDP-N-acetylglucosamine pyrophosphorylase/glucosamine-1-phosphate N-acetyltransferase
MSLDAIILAAGKGTRMNSTDVNKCMMPLVGKPMLAYELEALNKLGVEKPIVVVGFAADSIKSYFGDKVRYATQQEANGTATAVSAGVEQLGADVEEVIVLYGDHSAFYDETVLRSLIEHHRSTNADMTLVTVLMDNPAGYGRIMRDASGKMSEIVEEKNATDEQKAIREINSGNGIYKASFLRELLSKIESNPLTHEFYLTDIVKLGIQAGHIVETMVSDNEALSAGVNTPDQLAFADELMRRKINV